MTKEIQVRGKSATAWVVKEWYVWPFAWILAGRNYVRNIDELISKVVKPVLADGQTFDKLHILSHGGEGYIHMGGTDRLHMNDFDRWQYPIAHTDTAKFLLAVTLAMSEGGRLIFSACGQNEGALLSNISRYIGKRVTVSGHRKLGHPFGPGNIAFRNGFQLKP